ncbi:hypothetical protein [Aggregatibacter actinomycetemcomitans]|uniref:hypothetical protein n=1 Tax=Aggregatibacter actinomycetemcomitans TaxID=714 RepID=UPI00197CA015|nr:hypothetical protein [Aggregatibacter actinomycetemcomitans]MBN6078537.1 hypothetical protein [Aggregatibacter actinomycetemcomitans]
MTLDDAQKLQRANALRKIAQKSTKLAEIIGKRNPWGAVAVAAGAGLLVDGAIDKAFEMFTDAEKDEKGYFVWVANPNTNVKEKYYLEGEKPTKIAPIFVYKTKTEIYFFWQSPLYPECGNEDIDMSINCVVKSYAQSGFTEMRNPVIKTKNLLSQSETNRIYQVTFGYDFSDNQHDETTQTFVFNAEKRERQISKKYALGEPEALIKNLPADKPLVVGELNIERLLKELITLQGREFDSDERRVIDFAFSPAVFMQSDILKGREYLTKDDLLNFKHSKDMFDDKKVSKPSKPSKPVNPGSGGNNAYPNKPDEGKYGDPNYPNLEPPTARQILEPFKKFFPEFQNLTIQGKATQCPTWSFNALNRTYTIDSHCPILEQNRAILSALFTLIWSIIAIRKLLSA